MQIKLTDSAYSSKFHDIIHSWDRYIIAYGGRGSGKTDSFYLKYLLSLFEPYYFKLAYINKEQSNIRDQQYAGFKRVSKRCGLFDRLKFYDGDYRVVNTANDNMLIPKGMDDAEKTKGLDDITAIWWDEINKGTYEDFSALNELLRTPQAKYLQFAISFNPVSELHWLREKLFHPDNRHALHPEYQGQALLNRSTYLDNEFIDQEAYLQTLIMSAAGNKNSLRVNIEGDWGLEENTNPWLEAFDEEKHVKDTLPFFRDWPVYLSFDFNRSPVTCVAMQKSQVMGTTNSFIHFIKEFGGNMQLENLCQQIKAYFPTSILYVTGDKTGKNGNVGFEGRHTTYYSMIAKYMKINARMMDIDGKNMEHNDSRVLINTMLYNYPNIFISREGCPLLINDCLIAQVDEDSSKAGAIDKDREKFKMDYFDGFRYIFQTYFKSYAKKVYMILAD